jgi:hypothetical protein
MGLAQARFGHHLFADQQPQLDADAGKADPFSARLGARRQVVIPDQVAPLHAGAVVHDGQRRLRGVGLHGDVRGAGIQGVRHNLGQDGLLDRAGIGVAKVFQEVKQIDAGFAHGTAVPIQGMFLLPANVY